jgi:hypothetical protein
MFEKHGEHEEEKKQPRKTMSTIPKTSKASAQQHDGDGKKHIKPFDLIQQDSIWPLPLLSFLHCFGVHPNFDSLFEEDFGICPPLLHGWVGLQGVDQTFSFSFPSSSVHSNKVRRGSGGVLFANDLGVCGFDNWKVSPYINALQSTILLTPFVAIIHFHEEFIANVIKHLLETLIKLWKENQNVPYLCFSQISIL